MNRAAAIPTQAFTVAPLLRGAMKRGEAAAYCGHSPGHFDKLVRAGVYPSGRDAQGVTVWLRWELEAALSDLPLVGGQPAANSCDGAFGC